MSCSKAIAFQLDVSIYLSYSDEILNPAYQLGEISVIVLQSGETSIFAMFHSSKPVFHSARFVIDPCIAYVYWLFTSAL